MKYLAFTEQNVEATLAPLRDASCVQTLALVVKCAPDPKQGRCAGLSIQVYQLALAAISHNTTAAARHELAVMEDIFGPCWIQKFAEASWVNKEVLR